MSDVEIEIEGLDELIRRWEAAGNNILPALGRFMQSVLLKIWESVPSYPAPPPSSDYIRTGTLGRSLGSSEAGGATGGRADIYEVRSQGQYYEAHFGTKLSYAPYVIGDEEQADVHKGRWWTMRTIAEKVQPELVKLGTKFAEEIRKLLEG